MTDEGAAFFSFNEAPLLHRGDPERGKIKNGAKGSFNEAPVTSPGRFAYDKRVMRRVVMLQ